MQRGTPLAIALLIGLLLVPVPVVGHPYHLQAFNDVRDGPERIDSSNWIAQSFRAASAFFIARVSVYVADTGTNDSLILSIHPTALTFPSSTMLTQGSANGDALGEWLDVKLDPYVRLNEGDTYWIVASSPASGGEGYDWWNSGTDTAYGEGTGATSSDGSRWSPRGRDFTFRVYGYTQPALSFAASVADTQVQANRTTTITIDIVNDGPGTAEALWVNITLPAELAYVVDDAPAAGATLTGTYSYAFGAVGPSSRSFDLTVRAPANVPSATTVFVTVRIDSTGHDGVPFLPFIRNLAVELVPVSGPAPPPADAFWWWPILILGALAAGAFAVLQPRLRKLIVDEVFVADKTGVLLAHRSAATASDQDEDVLIGMFKAVQDFVKDAFSKGADEDFHALDFGERRILIERGQGHFIAVVYRGENRDLLRKRVQKVSRHIDASFGRVIESWNGEVAAVQGIALLLPRIWARRA